MKISEKVFVFFTNLQSCIYFDKGFAISWKSCLPRS